MATELWDDEVVGWKVGATSKEVQTLFGMAEPAYGPVFKQTVSASPARLKASAFQHLLLEAEFAFTFRESLPPRAKPYAREEVLAAIDALIPSHRDHQPEVQAAHRRSGPADGRRFLRQRRGDIRHTLQGLARSRPCGSRRLPLHRRRKRQDGTGALVLGNPLNVVEWFVSAFGAHGRTIEKGQFVMTGTMTGLHAPEPGQIAVADFGHLGKVEIQFD